MEDIKMNIYSVPVWVELFPWLPWSVKTPSCDKISLKSFLKFSLLTYFK